MKLKLIVLFTLALFSNIILADKDKDRNHWNFGDHSFNYNNHHEWDWKDDRGNCYVPDLPPITPPVKPPVCFWDCPPVKPPVKPVVTFKFNKPFNTPLSSCSRTAANSEGVALNSNYTLLSAPKVQALFGSSKLSFKDVNGKFVRVPASIKLTKPLVLKSWNNKHQFFNLPIKAGTYHFSAPAYYTSGFERTYDTAAFFAKTKSKDSLQRTLVVAPVGKTGKLQLRYYSFFKNGVYQYSKLQVWTRNWYNETVTRGYWLDCK